MSSRMPIPREVQENAARSTKLNLLYDLDNRSDPSHRHANTFTGLWKEYLIYEKWNKRINK